MKYAVAVVLLLAAAPLAGQDMQITAWVSQVDIDGDDDFSGFSTDFDEGFAMGISVNRSLSRFLSLEAAVFDVRNEANLLIADAPAIDLGDVNLTPITLGVQLHALGGSRFDPYVGAGAAYVMARELFSPDLEAGGVGRIEVDNQFTYYVNAGIGVQIAGGFGIVADGRWIPFETDSRSIVTGVEQEIDLTPTILSVGLRFRF